MSHNFIFLLGNATMLLFMVICYLGVRAAAGCKPPKVKPSTPAPGTTDYRERHAKFLSDRGIKIAGDPA